MNDRDILSRVLLLIAIALPIAGCTNPWSIRFRYRPPRNTIGVGQTAQFTATGVYGHGQPSLHHAGPHRSVTWTSSAPGVATVSSTGVATGPFRGHNHDHSQRSTDSPVSSSASATITVTGSSGGGRGGAVVIHRNHSQHLNRWPCPTQTGPIPWPSAPLRRASTVDLTNTVTWSSSSHADCHHRRHHRTCHRSGSGHSDHHRA